MNRYADQHDQSSDQDAGTDQGPPGQAICDAIEASSELLHQLVDQFSALSELATSITPSSVSGADQAEGNVEVLELRQQLQRRDQQIEELNRQLRQFKQQSDGVASVAATDPAGADDLIRNEREKLRAEWLERFREGEIAASLERAKLSRERRQLAQRNEELQEQLSHLRRQAEQDRKAGVAGARRWLAKLGLDDRKS